MSQFRIELGFDRNALASDFRNSWFYLPGDITRLCGKEWVLSTHCHFRVDDEVSFRIFDLTRSSARKPVASMNLTAQFIPAHDLPDGCATSPFDESDVRSKGFDDLKLQHSAVFEQKLPAWDVLIKTCDPKKTETCDPTKIKISNHGSFVARYRFKRTPPGSSDPKVYVHDPEWIIRDDGTEDSQSTHQSSSLARSR